LHESHGGLEACMEKKLENTVELFTDGACSGNPGPGGWGAILRWRGTDKELYGGEENTTNNRMEALAVIQGLKTLTKPSNVTVYTDSTYVQKGMTEWLEGWKAKGYKVKGGGLRVNHDLWRELDTLNQTHTVSWQWVKGHSGHPENERADELARQGVDLVR
jgi:ribonuclease HI